jgi:hypothetical protein
MPRPRLRPLLVLLLVLGLLAALAACGDDDGDDEAGADGTTEDSTGSSALDGPEEGVTQVFGGEGNNLQAYGDDGTDELQRQQVVTNRAEDAAAGIDINGQICFFPDDPNRFIAGEDTGQPDPPAGWGIFDLAGAAVGDLMVSQAGKLSPTYQPADSDPENYGCGFLEDGRILTTDVGNQAGGAGTGQLIVWFPPYVGEEGVDHCKVDVGIATAGQIAVGPGDVVYVGSARGDTIGVQQYTGDWPTAPNAAGGCGREDATGAPLVDDGAITRTTLVQAGPNGLATPNGVAIGPEGTLFVGSVVTGVINEYETDGTFLRTILSPPEGVTIGTEPIATGTPFGIGIAPDGTLYYADIGIVSTPGEGIGPADGIGTVRVIRFGEDGDPEPPVTVAEGLDFPDGIGVRPAAP